MTVLNKKFTLLFLVTCALAVWGLWVIFRPVEIIAVHQEDNYSDVLVENFPFTDREKIIWWQKNKDNLKERYSIPRPSPSGDFTVIFWHFGDGYMEEGKYDRLCFNDMPPPINCIEKDKAFTVSTDRHNNVFFGVYDGKYYINDKGKMIKTKY